MTPSEINARAAEIVDSLIEEHGERFPGTISLTRYPDDRVYRAMNRAESLSHADHEAINKAVADVIHEHFDGRVKVRWQTIDGEYLARLDSEGGIDSRDRRAKYAAMRALGDAESGGEK